MSPKNDLAEEARPAGKIGGHNCGATGKESPKLKEQTTATSCYHKVQSAIQGPANIHLMQAPEFYICGAPASSFL